MEKRPTAAEIPSDSDRCARSGYGHWRCPFPRFGGDRYCEKHRAYYIQTRANERTKRKRKRKRDERDPVRVRVSDHLIEAGKDKFEIEEEEEAKVSVLDRKKRRGRQPKMKKLDDIDDNDMRGKEEDTSVVRVLELGQIWAFSKEPDGFPRSYARIDHIFPIPSSVRATPLVLHPVSDEEMLLSKQGFSLACGMYRVSESSFIKEISAFTHRVVVDSEGEDGYCYYKVFPKKGEIWAVYSKWDESEKKFAYKLVEVVSDFSEGDGVDVFGLIKVESSESRVYKRKVHQGFYLVRGFKRGCMSTFSHQVPASRVVESGEVMWEVKLH